MKLVHTMIGTFSYMKYSYHGDFMIPRVWWADGICGPGGLVGLVGLLGLLGLVGQVGLMIQREFQLVVWTLIIQKSTVIPPSLTVVFTVECIWL